METAPRTCRAHVPPSRVLPAPDRPGPGLLLLASHAPPLLQVHGLARPSKPLSSTGLQTRIFLPGSLSLPVPLHVSVSSPLSSLTSPSRVRCLWRGASAQPLPRQAPGQRAVPPKPGQSWRRSAGGDDAPCMHPALQRGALAPERAQPPTGAPASFHRPPLPTRWLALPSPRLLAPGTVGVSNDHTQLEEGLLLRSVVVFQLKKHCAIWLCVLPLAGWHRGPSGEGSHGGPRLRLLVPSPSRGLPLCCFPCPQARVLNTSRSAAGQGDPFRFFLGTSIAPAVLILGP